MQRPGAYREVLISSAGGPIVLSAWYGYLDRPVVVFLPGTMTHPLVYEEFLDALNRAGLIVVGVHSQARQEPAGSTAAGTPVTHARADAVGWTRREFHSVPVAVVGSSQGGIVAQALAAAGEPLNAVFAHNAIDPTPPSTSKSRGSPGG